MGDTLVDTEAIPVDTVDSSLEDMVAGLVVTEDGLAVASAQVDMEAGLKELALEDTEDGHPVELSREDTEAGPAVD